MNDDSRRQQNVDKALAAFQKGESKKIAAEQLSAVSNQEESDKKEQLTEEKQFKCELCDLSYHFRQGLHRHKQSELHKRSEQHH